MSQPHVMEVHGVAFLQYLYSINLMRPSRLYSIFFKKKFKDLFSNCFRKQF